MIPLGYIAAGAAALLLLPRPAAPKAPVYPKKVPASDPLGKLPPELVDQVPRLMDLAAAIRAAKRFKKGYRFDNPKKGLEWTATAWSAPWNRFNFAGAVLADKLLRKLYGFKDGMIGCAPKLLFPKNWPAKSDRFEDWEAFSVDHAHDLYDRVKSAGGAAKIPWKVAIYNPGDPNAFERGVAAVAEAAPKLVGWAQKILSGNPEELARDFEQSAADMVNVGRKEAEKRLVNRLTKYAGA